MNTLHSESMTFREGVDLVVDRAALEMDCDILIRATM